MPIEIHKGGGLSVTGKGIDLFRLLVLKRGLMAEIRGMKLSRGRSCFAIVKEEFGLKGNKQKVLEQFEKLVEEANKSVVRIEEGEVDAKERA